MLSRCNWKILQISCKIAARMLLTSQCELAGWLFLLFPAVGRRCITLWCCAKKDSNVLIPDIESSSWDGEGVRGAEGWTLLCPLCTQSQLYPRGRWAGLLVLANEDGLTCVTSVSEEKAKMWPITDLPKVQWLLLCLHLGFNEILVQVLPCLLWLKIKTEYIKSTSSKMLLCLTQTFPIPHLQISPHPLNRKGHQRPWSNREVFSSMFPM